MDVSGLAPIDLEHELTLSNLTDSEIGLLKEQSQGICSIFHCLQSGDVRSSRRKVTILLGLDAGQPSINYLTISRVCGVLTHRDAQVILGVTSQETDYFVPAAIRHGYCFDFLLPRNIFDHPMAGTTAREMRWFLDRPEELFRVAVVVGAYEVAICPNSLISEG